MVYEYEEETSFFATQRTEVFKTPGEYEAYEGDLDSIRFPAMSKEDVVQNAKIVLRSGDPEGDVGMKVH